MNDRDLENVVKYDVVTEKITKGRGGAILWTNKGCKLFLECQKRDYIYVKEDAVTKALIASGFPYVDSYYYNSENSLFTQSEDGKKYVMKNWYYGRECDVRDIQDLKKAVRQLAFLHLSLNVVAMNGIKVDAELINDRGNRYVWESMATGELQESCEEGIVRAASAGGVFSEQQEDIRETYTRHMNELKKINNYLKHKKNKTRYEQMVVKAMGEFLEEAKNAVERFRDKAFDDRFDLAVKKGELAHGAFNYHNVMLDINNDRQTAITGYEHCKNTCQIIDLYQFLRKVLEKHNWNTEIAYEIIDEYDRIKPLEDVELDIITVLLSFPEKFWKLVNQYYNSSKTWIPAKNIDKFKMVLEQNKGRRDLIDKIGGVC